MGDAGDDPPPPPAAADPATGPEGAPDADGPDGGAENGAPGGGAEGAGGMPEGGQGPHEEEPGSGSAVADRLKAVRKGGRPGGMRRLTVLPTAGQTAALAGAQVRPAPFAPRPSSSSTTAPRHLSSPSRVRGCPSSGEPAAGPGQPEAAPSGLRFAPPPPFSLFPFCSPSAQTLPRPPPGAGTRRVTAVAGGSPRPPCVRSRGPMPG